MDNFQQKLMRLKQELGLEKDYEVADALGLSKTAFAERKKRASFPHKEMLTLAASRPGLDVNYVLTGERTPENPRMNALMRRFALRLQELQEEVGPAKLAAILGVPLEDLNPLVTGARLATLDQFERLVRGMPDKSPAWLSGGQGPVLDAAMTQIEMILIANYRASSSEGQEALRRQAAFHAEFNQRGLS